MTQSKRGTKRQPHWIVLWAILLVGIPMAPTTTGDDIDLLRFDTAKPYLFIILDTSTSMNLDINNNWVHANGDDPRSKIYQAKEVLYEVLEPVDSVHFGFVGYNQDQLRVTGKHYLYSVADTAANQAAIDSLPIAYPLVEPNDQIEVPILDTDGDPTGDVDVDIDGDLLTFGPRFYDSGGALVPGGTCNDPLDLSRDREKINRFAKLGANSTDETEIWVQGGTGNKTFRLTFRNPTAADKLGKASLNVELTMELLGNGRDACDGPNFNNNTFTATLQLNLYRPFVMWDDSTTAVHLVPSQTKNKNLEDTGGHWDWRGIEGNFSCGPDKPFSGHGWEGNYDTGDPNPLDAVLDPGGNVSDSDTYCTNPANAATCSNELKRQTTVNASGNHREIDLGDMLPFHWTDDHQDLVLRRFNPRHGSGEDFGVANYFQDTPNAAGHLELAVSSQIPTLAAGNSPLSDLIVDFRCWYSSTADNKCRNDDLNFPTGFQALAEANDNDWVCRRPYLLFITDGENNCSGENPTADVAGLFSKFGIRSWVVNLGTSNQGEINSIVNPGQGQAITVESKQDLRTELERILGIIEEEARAFASAAVPTVQADVSDKIYITNFTPLQGEASWDGHIQAFLKPLPIREGDNKPDINHPNHLWDAGEVMALGVSEPGFVVERQAPLDSEVTVPVTRTELRAGNAANQRRIYYPMEPDGRTVPRFRQLLAPPAASEVPTGMNTNDVREDQWRGLGLVDDSFELGDVTDTDLLTLEQQAALLEAHILLEDIYVVKEATVDNADGSTTDISYVLGDIFHSNPQVIGGPNNVRFFADNLFGYREFAKIQQRRRKVLIVGANDGYLHGFDVGVYRGDVKTGAFDNGTGRELFAIAPRTLMPTLEKIHKEGNSAHQWGVDGTSTVADAYLDVEHLGIPEADDRTWRTVAVTGLRRGGNAYFAVDMTEPDTMVADVEPVTNINLGYIPQPVGDGDMPGKQTTWPSILWEFTDTADEDGNGSEDLGQTWSSPGMGAIQVIEDGVTVVKFVTVFGGGLDPSNRRTGGSGNWLYMVDVETGTTLYKRQLEGAAPADVAAVDTNQDGFLDRLYIGDLAGYVYRADIGVPQELVDGYGSDGMESRVIAAEWAPYKVFDTVTDASGVAVRRPIYFAPSVIFVSQIGGYALAFGTGDREELWSVGPAGGNRFYVFVDDSDRLDAASLPMTEATLTELSGLSTTDNLLAGSNLYGARGWYMVLDEALDERVVTPASAVSGITVFSTFLPDVTSTGTSGDLRCEKRGNSRNYVVFTANGDPGLEDELGNETRYQEVGRAFVTEPYIEQGQTRNADGTAAAPLTERLQNVMDSLKQLYPDNCRFADGYRFDIKTVRSDTGVVHIAPLPVCIRETNWKEF